MAVDLSGVITVNGNKLELPKDVTTQFDDNLHKNSIVAQLAAQYPFVFRDNSVISFPDDAKAEIVQEGQPSNGEHVNTTITHAQRVHVDIINRISTDALRAGDDDSINYGALLGQRQSKGIGRQLDDLILHGVSDLDGGKVTNAGDLDDAENVQKLSEAKDPRTSLDNLTSAVNKDWVPSGIALNRTFADQLRTDRNSLGEPLFPNLTMSLTGNVDGIPTAVSSTVTPDLAVLGDFSQIRWAYIGGLNMELIQYGDPDGLGDLQRQREVAVRTSTWIAYQIIHPEAFAILQASTTGSASSKSSK